MKNKFKIFSIPLIAAAMPVASITCCSNNNTKDYSLLATKLVEQAVVEFFEICKTPHPSYNLDGIRQYFKSVIQELKSTCNQDAYGNI